MPWFFSHVRYCIQVYGGTSVGNISKIQKIFNFAARVIPGRKKYDHITDLLKQYEWLDATQFIAYSDMCMLHKIVNSGQPSPLASQFSFNRDVVGRPTRQSDQLALFRPRTNHGKRCPPPPLWFFANSPEVLGISLWNLPYLSGQQFHTLCQKIRTHIIIGQPWVTSEWRHVSPILINKMGLRESPPLVQF